MQSSQRMFTRPGTFPLIVALAVAGTRVLAGSNYYRISSKALEELVRHRFSKVLVVQVLRRSSRAPVVLVLRR